MVDESTRLFPREIAVLRAVQGSFRELKKARRPVDGLVLQIAIRLDEVGERVPGHWRADNGKRVRTWLMSPSGLPAYPRIRARSTSPPRYEDTEPPSPGQSPLQPPPPKAVVPAHAVPTVGKFRRGVQHAVKQQQQQQQPLHVAQPAAVTPPPVALPDTFEDRSDSYFRALASGDAFGLEGVDSHPSVELPKGSSPSSVVAASWQLYDEALRRFTQACDESDTIVRSGKYSNKQKEWDGLEPIPPPLDTSLFLTKSPVSNNAASSLPERRNLSPRRSPSQATPSPEHSKPQSLLPSHLTTSAHKALRVVEEARAVMSQAPPSYHIVRKQL